MVVGPWSSRHDHCWWHSVIPLFMMTHLRWWQHIYAILCQFMTRFYQCWIWKPLKLGWYCFEQQERHHRVCGDNCYCCLHSRPGSEWLSVTLLAPGHDPGPGGRTHPVSSVALPHVPHVTVSQSQARKLTLDRTTLNVLCGAWSVFSVLFDSLLFVDFSLMKQDGQILRMKYIL